MKTSVDTFCKRNQKAKGKRQKAKGRSFRFHFCLLPFAFCLLIFLFTACGKIGDPLPPIPRSRLNVEELSVEQQGTQLILSFPFTRTTRTRLQRVDVYRLIEPPSDPLGLPVEIYSGKAHVIHSITASEIPLNSSTITYNDSPDIMRSGQRNTRFRY
ncbi:MAG: hypothetical protein L0Y75_07995, partial [Acidobacteria bacterium]|nr:hypothetical protein [Acidobacteriota bacterium]